MNERVLIIKSFEKANIDEHSTKNESKMKKKKSFFFTIKSHGNRIQLTRTKFNMHAKVLHVEHAPYVLTAKEKSKNK